MDFGDRLKPNSPRNLLQQQVEEQSRVCDVTVKNGTWIKRYHLHVLVESPFFEHAFEPNFQEHTSGVVELQVGSPTTIDMTIMYLYGKSPELSMNNIAECMDLAEFLLLPNMKKLCINWLHTEQLSESNAVDFLHLCSLYEFNLEQVYDFIESRLLTFLNGDRMLTLTPESIAILFSDERLSYVPSDLRINFITRWIDLRKTSRTDDVRKLAALIDLPQMKIEQGRLANQNRLCLITFSYKQKCVLSELHAYCFNTQQWFNLSLQTSLRKSENTSVHVDGCQVIYYNKQKKCLYGQDLEQKKSWCSSVEYDEPTGEIILSKLIVKNNECYLILTNINSSDNATTTVQMGKLTNNSDAIHLSTVYVCSGRLLCGCVNSSNMIAILTEVKHCKVKFNIYDTKSSETYDGSHLKVAERPCYLQIFGTDNGFAVIEGSAITIIRYQEDADMDVPFTKMNVDGTIRFRFAFIGDTVYRSSPNDSKLELTELNRLLTQNPVPAQWRSIDLPNFPRLPFNADESLLQNLACISIPMTSPICHFKCPHCQLLDRVCDFQWPNWH